MNIKIRLAKTSDLKEYTKLLQETYQSTYVEESLGLTKECFSREIFVTPDTQAYLKSKLKVGDKRKTWLVFLENKMVGSITIEDKGTEYKLSAFYVLPEYQGRGIGKQLWQKVLSFAKNKDIILDVYTHNTKAIDIYTNWGFVVDKKKKAFYSHWPEWPEGVQTKSIYMRLSKTV